MRSIRFRRKRPKPVETKSPVLTFVQAWVPIIAVILGGLFTTWTYVNDHRVKLVEYEKTQKIEAQRPFLTKKMELFLETARTAGDLTAVKVGSKEWKAAKQKIYALRWGAMEMSGNPVVRLAMREVIAEVNALESATPEDRERRHARLRNSVECLSDELRYSLEEAWGNPVEPVEDRASSSEPSRTDLPTGCWQPEEIKKQQRVIFHSRPNFTPF
ncbi:hypothetical protein [Bradyrhizobium roseum]|uniref:hypothetical protein n=1 Tax=Bradyrhizobium roseum TaxID=3056648 RepID=UPI00263A1EE7|nr:hypothetical protein [Bradyrhizobium roseus]WKA29812.1 hypothetical protein QUH67_06455 [Bradyrhizobium roseus]